MKKGFIISIFFSILLGYIVGSVLYLKYEDSGNAAYNSYLLQQGIYASKNDMKEATKELENYAVMEHNGKYYVYVGITTNKHNAEKVRNAFKESNIEVQIKKSIIDNIEFLSNLEQYDVLLGTAKEVKDIMAINEVILSSYEEIVMAR